MASGTYSAVQNENLHIYRGKGVNGEKVDVSKSEAKGLKNRKALADLSNAGKPTTGALKVHLKEKSSLRGSETIKKAPKRNPLTEDEVKKCHEWAKEGIEHVHFTENDLHKLHQDMQEERVKKKVQKVMSALSEWCDITHGLGTPSKDLNKIPEDDIKFELEPEVFYPLRSSWTSFGTKKFKDSLEEEPFRFPCNEDDLYELRLKEDD
ncbi:hypothetical protein QJS10_CPA06g01922 [Acorus calamus]|uniref:Uncharacterized protein n=1 Tax=Acorus calamus TaxID=4465 RepID=A0AAV9EMR1_ACOCL|nr:hypothetical protein QJS10_CPA06g01922 [Acorus calamus]